VRVAGVSIAAALTATEAGRITMATQCHNVPGGIWGAAFGLLLDPAECSAVRQQVMLIFCYNKHYITVVASCVGNDIWHINEVTLREAWLVLGWVVSLVYRLSM